MKKTTLIFVIWVFLLGLTLLKIYPFPKWFLFSMFLFCCLAYYVRIHSENKTRNIPMPVYLTNPQ